MECTHCLIARISTQDIKLCADHSMTDSLLECLEEAKMSITDPARRSYMVSICDKARNAKEERSN